MGAANNRAKPDDWKYHNHPNYDNKQRFFTDCEQELPCDDDLWKENWEKYINANLNSDERICLAFETHTGMLENDTISKSGFDKMGFKLEGVKRQQFFHKGKYWDECLYGLLAAEFNAQK